MPYAKLCILKSIQSVSTKSAVFDSLSKFMLVQSSESSCCLSFTAFIFIPNL